jgi:hypothetical protein
MLRFSLRLFLATLVLASVLAIPSAGQAAPVPACAGYVVGSLNATTDTLHASCTFTYTGGPVEYAAMTVNKGAGECQGVFCTFVYAGVSGVGECGGSGGCIGDTERRRPGVRRFETLTCRVTVTAPEGPVRMIALVFGCGSVGLVSFPRNYRPPRPVCDLIGCAVNRRLAT